MRKLSILSGLLICSLGAGAQNLNPQVQVTNDYLANLSQRSKNTLEMAVPDSLREFKTKVDYNVYSPAYKGAYEFTPYDIKVVPEAQGFTGTKFFMRAGAGYPVHPVLQAIFTPNATGKFRFDIYQNLYGYCGQYSSVVDSRDPYKGYNLLENIGVEGRVNGKKVDVFGNVNYKGIYVKDNLLGSSFHDINLTAGVKNNQASPKFYYDAKAGVGYDTDVYKPGVDYSFNDFKAWTSFRLMPEIYQSFRLALDGNAKLDLAHSNASSWNLFLLGLNPKLLYDVDFLSIKAGASLYFGDGFGIYPDVVISAKAIRDKLGIYVAATGGENLNCYYGMKAKNHWFNPGYTSVFHTTKEKINLRAGLRGTIFSNFQYDINGGYAIYKNAVMDCLLPGAIDTTLLDQGILFRDYETWFVNGLFAWKNDRLDVNADIQLRFTDIVENAEYLGVPVFRGYFSAIYNWQHRAYAGVRARLASRTPYTRANIKAYQDIGLYGEYRFANGLGVWAQVGNLLNQKLVASPMHVERGINFTAGITLRIQ